MASTQDMRRINKSECFFLIHWWKSQRIEPPCGPSSLHWQVIRVLEPTNPQKFHPPSPIVQHTRASEYNINVINAKNPGVDILMAIFLGRKQHNIPVVRVRVDGVLCPAYIICGIIDPHDVVLVHAIAFEVNAIKGSRVV